MATDGDGLRAALAEWDEKVAEFNRAADARDAAVSATGAAERRAEEARDRVAKFVPGDGDRYVRFGDRCYHLLKYGARLSIHPFAIDDFPEESP